MIGRLHHAVAHRRRPRAVCAAWRQCIAHRRELIARRRGASRDRPSRCRAHLRERRDGGSRPRCTARRRGAADAPAREHERATDINKPREAHARGCRIARELCQAARVRYARGSRSRSPSLVIVICARIVAGGQTWDDIAYHTEVAPRGSRPPRRSRRASCRRGGKARRSACRCSRSRAHGAAYPVWRGSPRRRARSTG